MCRHFRLEHPRIIARPVQSLSTRGMSALGQKQTLGKVRPMSALPPKADIDRLPHMTLKWPLVSRNLSAA